MDLIAGSSITTTHAIYKLASLLIIAREDAKLMNGIELLEIQELRSVLELLDSIHKDANDKSWKAVPLTSWLEQIKNAAKLIDDIVNGYMLEVSQRQLQQPDQLIRRVSLSFSTRRSLSSDIEIVKALLVRIQETGYRY